MITIIAGTNRANSNTQIIANAYQKILAEKNIVSQIFSLATTQVFERNDAFIEAENKFLKVEKVIIIMPEYNGSFPGILKLMIDNSDIKNVWYHKKILLTGISTGRAGNLRGIDHLTTALLYIKAHIHPNRLPISVVNTLIKNGELVDNTTLETIAVQLDEFVAY